MPRVRLIKIRKTVKGAVSLGTLCLCIHTVHACMHGGSVPVYRPGVNSFQYAKSLLQSEIYFKEQNLTFGTMRILGQMVGKQYGTQKAATTQQMRPVRSQQFDTEHKLLSPRTCKMHNLTEGVYGFCVN